MEELSGGNSAPASAGPTTFAEAFASDASPASESPAQSNTPPEAALPATDAADSPPGGDERSPFIPRSRFDEVNTERNALKQWKEQYGWAESADRQAIEQAVEIGRLYSTDRLGYARQLLSDMSSDPQLGPQLRSELARMLGTRQQQAPPAPAGPDLDGLVIDLGGGQTVPLKALKEAWLGEAEQKFAPVVETANQLRQANEDAQKTREAMQFAKGFYADLQKRPDFEALKPEIAKRLSAERFTSDHPAEVRAATYRIYMELSDQHRTTDIAKAKSDQLDDLQRRAAASTSPNPGSAAPSTPRSPKSFYDRDLKW